MIAQTLLIALLPPQAARKAGQGQCDCNGEDMGETLQLDGTLEVNLLCLQATCCSSAASVKACSSNSVPLYAV